MLTDPTVEQVRQRAGLAEVIGQYLSLQPAGNGRMKACCPFHDEKTPSFYVSPDKGFYKCFGCGKSGDVFTFVQAVENITFPEALKSLAERYGVALPSRRQSAQHQEELTQREKLQSIIAAAQAFFREQFQSGIGSQARDYAAGRGLSPATLERFGIGYAPDAWDALLKQLAASFPLGDIALAGLVSQKEKNGEVRHYDRFRHRLMFPIWDESGRAIAFGGRALEGGRTGNPDAKYLNSPESPIFHKSNVLFAWHIARGEVSRRESVIITEGYMDAIALHEAGFPQTVATLGTALTAHHVALLRRLSPKVVYLCFDGDSAGMRAALRTAPLFAEHTLDVRVVRFPKEDDPDTYVRTHGKSGLQALLEAAVPLTRYRLECALSDVSLLTQVSRRPEIMRMAAQIINEVNSATEREGYIAWLTDSLAAADHVSLRGRQFLEDAVRRELAALANARYQGGGPDVGGTVVGNTPARIAGIPHGVILAEKMLLGVLLFHPMWRETVQRAIPLEKWSVESHVEIAAAVSAIGPQDDINPATLTFALSPEATEIVSDLAFSQTMAPDLRIIEGWISRLRLHWAKIEERELVDLVNAKINRGEVVTAAERAALSNAMAAARRKTSASPESTSSLRPPSVSIQRTPPTAAPGSTPCR